MRDFAIKLALDAGQVLREHFGGTLEVETKSSEIDPVTNADRASEALILERLRRTFPQHAILAEESGAHETSASEWRWVVDPLDGTVNFAHGLPHFCVSIALYKGDRAHLGVIYDPMRDELFWAERDKGAWMRDAGGSVRRLQVSNARRLRESIVSTGFHYLRDRVRHNNIAEFEAVALRVQGVRRLGSAALDLAYVAAGRLDGYWEYYLAPWDWAAGTLIVTEAGGAITTVEGDPWHLGVESIAAANPHLLPLLLEALQSARTRETE
ncbi:myo-inositol-1(or 4)-monophosphatase [Ardenticatena maritima]|uniref:Inositol-1-monophosphatase n=1 Tax=Ardenticatena maritima TaxID=872965 RepID=A0A0M8K7P2_9CHLR|nr:inositol monophosphatase family protein [Ardenticatena maritima]KPL88265.1 hypothetical protein SE16_05330 [Ardenticatena maritima]GAP62422.1 myo-inositol-1(or 4)-monophosphatase [Ardenticatena maritima]